MHARRQSALIAGAGQPAMDAKGDSCRLMEVLPTFRLRRGSEVTAKAGSQQLSEEHVEGGFVYSSRSFAIFYEEKQSRIRT